HEMGHYFGLRHIWGDDQGLCIDNGGEDDGIEDTPLQADATYSCLDAPYYDDCTYDGNGIMFMNFMDYTPDECVSLFTAGQVSRMCSELLVDGPSYSLTQHPYLLEPPGNESSSSFTIWPNPTAENINIYFEQPPQNLQGIHIIDALGRTVGIISDYRSQGSYSFNTTLLSSGIYYIRAVFDNSVQCNTVIVSH
ncbi:MAG TPA: zinc-dependent metalloprotease, partial [Flavipsychrobacter sp.]|nr:zinc-dependent metalloprotease [Flavipsychrobacter sp.]